MSEYSQYNACCWNIRVRIASARNVCNSEHSRAQFHCTGPFIPGIISAHIVFISLFILFKQYKWFTFYACTPSVCLMSLPRPNANLLLFLIATFISTHAWLASLGKELLILLL